MEKLHKRNLIIVWCSVVALSLVSLMGYGFTVLAIRGIAILVVAGIISTIGCYLSIDDAKKVLILVFPPAIGTLLYSWVYGGNSIPYLANFVLLAMTTSYFMESVIIYFAVPFTVISVVFMIFSPETIAGSEYSMAGVVTRVFLFIVTAILLYFATKRGAGVVKKTEETLSIVQNNAKVANTISTNLNTTIHKSMSSVHALADGSSSVKSAASQMGQVVEDTANATVSVMDKINAATTEINRNHELAVSLDQGFQKVQSAVEKGNGGYSLTAENEEIVAIQQVDDTRFNLIGKKAGITTVFVRDEAEQELSLTVTVVQADKVANLGSGNYFKVPFEYNGTADESLKNLSTLTFEARFNIESLNGNDNGNARINTVMGIEKKFLLRVDVHKGGSNDEERFLQLAADDKGSIRYEGSTKIETNKWYDVAVVLDNSKSGSERIALYVNGVRETLQLSNGTPDDLKEINLTSDFYIGQSDGKRRLNGAISYARIWTKALSDQQISEQSGKLLSEDKDGMVANWLFNNGNGNTKTFVSLAGKSFEAEAANIVSSWKTDPILETSAPTE